MNKNILWQGEILKFIQSVVDLVQEKEKKKKKLKIKMFLLQGVVYH